MAIVVFLGIVIIFLIIVPNYFQLSTVFRWLKVLSVISLLLPILSVVWLYTVDPLQDGEPAYNLDIFVGMLNFSIACVGSLAFAWLVGYLYWRYAKKNNLFEISSFYVALMLIAAIAGWITTPILVLWALFGDRY